MGFQTVAHSKNANAVAWHHRNAAKRRVRSSRRAFSILELMAVGAILGVVSAIALPAISELAAERAASTEVNKVKTELDAVRDRARKTLRCLHVTRPNESQLQIDELESSASGCGTTVASSTVRDFNGRAVEITTDLDLTFDRTGGLTGVSDDYVEVIVAGKRRGRPDQPHTYRVYRILGLVRRLG